MAITLTDANLYDILSLPKPTPLATPSTVKEIRAAYKRALLVHHPDKKHKRSHTTTSASLTLTKPSSQPTAAWTIDQITHAYTILSSPTSRAAYDSQLLALQRTELVKRPRAQTTELEVVDLDDMEHDDHANTWTKRCRCGNQTGYAVEESLLMGTEESGSAEVLVSCADCSHHVRVFYTVEVIDN